MRSLVALSAALLAFTCRPTLAQTSTPATSASASYRDEPLVFEHYDNTYHFNADGTGTHTIHVALRIQSEGAIRQWGVLSFIYASAVESATIDLVRVHKADGSTADTPVSDALDMPAPVTQEAPLFSDLKQKQIPVRNLAVGDTLEYTTHTTRTTPEAPNQFWGSEHFTSTGLVVLSQTLTLQAPSGTYVQVWSPHHLVTPTERDGVRSWSWTSSQLQPSGRDKDGNPTGASADQDPDTDADGRNLPSVAWTTFHSWAEVGAWYRSLALDRAQPTPDVQKEATELTTGLSTPEAQAQALYTFVSTKIRYVGVDLGIGRYQPHAASDVLSSRYGDCKDKDTLLEALLRARGLHPAPALIGYNLQPVPELPSPALFNHVITTVDLPTGRIWMDATPEVNPFRVLTLPIRDQRALLVLPAGDAVLARTPADPPFPFTETFDATAILDTNGMLKGHIIYTTRSDNEPGIRMLVQRVAPAQWDDSIQYLSNALGFGGKVSHADLHQADPAAPVRLSYDYTRPEFADWANKRILPLFPLLEIPVIDKEKAPEHDIDQGAPRTLLATTRITLPPGFRPDLPQPIHAKRPYATFDQTYRFSDGDVLIERTVHIVQRKVPKADWKDYLAYVKSIGVETGENYISLIALPEAEKTSVTLARVERDPDAPRLSRAPTAVPTTTTPRSGSSPAQPPTASAAQLVEEARLAEDREDWSNARVKLDQARSLDIHTRYLQSMLGFLALRDHKPDDAIDFFKAELHDHPDDTISILRLLAKTLEDQDRAEEAVKYLQTSSSPDTAELLQLLARAQQLAGHKEDAVLTLKTASTAHPEDRRIHTALAGAFFETNRDREAVTTAKLAMDGADDPILLNDNCYLLAQLKSDLDLAEQNTRLAVLILETRTATRSLATANAASLRDTVALAHLWDTLGFILLRRERLSEAEPFLAASWFNFPELAVGNHLGQLYEAKGQPTEALALYTVALSSEQGPQHSRDREAVKSSIARLQAAGIRPATGNAARSLQELATLHVRRPNDLSGSGTLRLQLASFGVTDSALVGGPATFEPIRPELANLKLPDAVPTGSHARIVRDAVVRCSSGQPTCELVFMSRSNLSGDAVQ